MHPPAARPLSLIGCSWIPTCSRGTTYPPSRRTKQPRRTSEGEPFRVSFRFSPPPAISRFYLHLLKNPEGSECETKCRIVGSHRNALLFCLYAPLPVPVDKFPADFPYESLPRFSRQNLFVYIAGITPSLILLPPCLESPVETDEEDDTSSEELYDPLAGTVFFTELDGVGVLCNDDGDFVVAYLCVSRVITTGSGAEYVEAQMWLHSSSKSEWEQLALPVHCAQEDIGTLISWSWSTKGVVAFGSYLCWIVYNFGLLFCEVFGEDLRVSYVRLPLSPSPYNQPCVGMYRNICIVEDEGKCSMKFVDVRPSDGYVYLPRSDGFEFNLWTLTIEDGIMNWKHEHEFWISHDELNVSNLVPSRHGPLTFPIVSMQEPHVAYFVVGERRWGVKKVWLLPVDLISKSAEHVFPYLKGNEDLLGEDADMAKSKSHDFSPFLPSDITKYFAQIAGNKSVSKTTVSLPITGDTAVVRKTPCSSPSYLQGDLINVPKPNVRKLHSEAPTECAWNIVPRPQDIRGDVPTKVQVSFRLLCQVNLIGDLIGKRGAIIQQIIHGTGAHVYINGCLSGCMEECVISIAALEGPEQWSNVQCALLRIFERMVEVGRDAKSMLYSPSQSTLRALLRESQLDYLVGEIEEIVNVTRVHIQILYDMDVPACAAPRERVLQGFKGCCELNLWKGENILILSLKRFYATSWC